MAKLAHRLRGFFGGLIAVLGACLVGWQAVLIYYLVTGRVESGEEHPPMEFAIVVFLFGLLLLGAGYFISKSGASGSK